LSGVLPERRRRFALLAPNYFPVTCGVGDHSMRLAGELRRRGHEAVVFSHQPVEPNPERPDVPVVGVPGGSPLFIATEVARRIDTASFSDVVIQYAGRMWGASRFGSAAVALLAANLQRAGLEVTLIAHELFTPWRYRPDLALGALASRLQLAGIMRSCAHIFVTTETRGQLIAGAATALEPPRPADIMRIGPNALPVSRQGAHRGHRLGLFSTLAFGKHFDVVVGAFERVQRSYPDATLSLIGDLGRPENPAARQLAERIAASTVRERIQVTGRLPLAQVADAVAALDLYLFPMDTGANTRSGTLPLALGAGVPVVAISGSETDPLFVDGDNVLFAGALTETAFAQTALRLLDDASLAERVARGGRRLYEQHLSWERIGEAFLASLG
jgi:glycosyltransferase involved in cell wall biosynthesis